MALVQSVFYENCLIIISVYHIYVMHGLKFSELFLNSGF